MIHYLGVRVETVGMTHHPCRSYLSTSLDALIPELDAIAEFKCVYPTSKFPPKPSWMQTEQVQSQLECSQRKKCFWLMCQFETITISPFTFETWREKVSEYQNQITAVDRENNARFVNAGIFLRHRTLCEHEAGKYVYSPENLTEPEAIWKWMSDGLIKKEYFPMFWVLKKVNLVEMYPVPDWLEKRDPYLRPLAEMLKYFSHAENKEEFNAYMSKYRPAIIEQT